ncbi:sensor histidine kinase [Sphaerisporangium siamense]|uniref:histidine kinase n=1 Tax=Sphaerisporangium siamense TaxID=795645 RepID=A0A7W7DCD6_9ACTN|nr:sensor histidine kinase [Sphaerisporangium siamense]MBB4703101.1 signal transduction histidine kinase [Sphaerisporangium siamense]
MPAVRPTLRQVAVDVVIAATLLAVDIGVGGNVLRDETHSPWRLPVSLAVAAVIAVALALRRYRPLGALVLIMTLSVPAAALGLLWDPFVAAACALYTLTLSAQGGRAARATACAAAAVAAAGAAGAVLRPGGGWWWYAPALPLLAGAWRWGLSVRDRREQAIRLERQRDHQVLMDERLRIARELHDVMTHGMGLIAVKAGIANHLARNRPEEALDALRVIEATSKEALAETRRLLGVLREDTGPAPAPTLAGLAELAERASVAGADVELSVRGGNDLPEPVELAAYRIVQEAVTNVVKHAAPARCRVSVLAEDGVVTIEVTDDGRGARSSAGPPGHGIVGMRERVTLYDGRFAAGPLPQGGFQVSATLRYRPVGGDAR